MKYDYYIKKVNKWQKKLSKRNSAPFVSWTQRIQNSYKNYCYWCYKLPILIAPVRGCKVTRKLKKEIINLIKKKKQDGTKN